MKQVIYSANPTVNALCVKAVEEGQEITENMIRFWEIFLELDMSAEDKLDLLDVFIWFHESEGKLIKENASIEEVVRLNNEFEKRGKEIFARRRKKQ